MKIPFDIFIGGPMGTDERDAAGDRFSTHLPNLTTVLKRIKDEIEATDKTINIRIQTPEIDESGMITNRIFGMIDAAELAIMDVSAGSAGVMYELAMLHALGTPTIPVVLRDAGGKRKTPFYLKDSYSAVVPNFGEDALYARLASMVRMALYGGGGPGANPAMNPMTVFYDIALVDASATTGLATGYFHNFIRHVIRETGGVFTALDYQVEKFVILQPEKLSQTSDMLNRVKSRLRAAGVAVTQVTKDGETIYEDDAQVRKGMLIFRAGRFLFDIPAPLNVQSASPRYKRIKREADLNAIGPFREETQAKLKRHEQILMDKFFTTLRYLARNEQNVNPDLMEFMTLDAFVAALTGR